MNLISVGNCSRVPFLSRPKGLVDEKRNAAMEAKEALRVDGP